MALTSNTQCSYMITTPILDDDDVVRIFPSDIIVWDNRYTKGVRLCQQVLGESVSG